MGLTGCTLPTCAQVFQSIAKDVMERLQDSIQEGSSPSAAAGAGGGGVHLGGAAAKKPAAKSGCC